MPVLISPRAFKKATMINRINSWEKPLYASSVASVPVKTAAESAKMDEVKIGRAFTITAKMAEIKIAKRCQASGFRPSGVGINQRTNPKVKMPNCK